MEIDILNKIEKSISLGDYTEPQVLYILAEIRKLFEKNNVRKYKALSFMANWVLHPKLDRSGAKDLLKALEDSIQADGFAKNAFGFLSFHAFKKELIEFLDAYSISTATIQKLWPAFLNSFIAIISDCPLENTQGSIIKSFTIQASSNGSYEYHATIIPGTLSKLGAQYQNIKDLRGFLTQQ